ncbi:enediyne biosynthesis protein UnbU [Jatrophihabitans lederbergiae]|uniref:Enediyne biosynthesis protein UnbU n=1 Tax=Jatrophihabitans lederbergiae TaxID=3075547 RepID=A0ABU2JE14_9ACTN|nr:enediyne biosynthesis protein UnbU [Jatrophihabitans sp. DSM 44399]MDT0263238.1 enediyne biosynthesis protein UnbU [Jatrophihabitans sp. DSM 44399]
MTAVANRPLADSAPPSATAKPSKPKPDPRYLALRNFALSITIFNVFGYALLGFEQPYMWPVFALLTGYAVEITFELISAWAYQRRPRFLGGGPRGIYEFLLPAHITALAVNMLLYANNQILPVIFGVFVGVAGKHVFQAPINGRMRHFMNPSNFGIAVSLLCFGSWVSIAPPYQFTENANTFFRIMIPLIMITAGTVLNAVLTRKVPLVVGWMGGFAIQAFVRHGIWDVALFSALGSMTGVAFVLFTNYMITDPGTTPMKPRAQFMFGSSVAVIYGVLMEFNVTYTLFYALVVVCALRGIGWWSVALIERSLSRREPEATVSDEEVPTTTLDRTDLEATPL